MVSNPSGYHDIKSIRFLDMISNHMPLVLIYSCKYYLMFVPYDYLLILIRHQPKTQVRFKLSC